MVWIAGGIGITPFLSMARALTIENNSVRPLLLWNVRRPEDFIYLDELKSSTEVVELLDNDDAPWEGRRGRMNTAFFQEVLNEDQLAKGMFFICGPPAMMKAVRESLSSLGVEDPRMLWERFAL